MICRSSASIERGVVADFLQRMREHPQQQRFVRLTGAEQTHVGLRGRRQQAAQRIERLGADDRSVDPFRVFRQPSDTSRESAIRAPESTARRRVECAIERVDEPCAQRRAVEFGGHVIFPPAVRSIGVRYVACRLLEIRHQPSPLEHFGQDVRDALTRQVGAPELRDRIVAVFAEDAGVQLVGAPRAGRRPRPRSGAGPSARRTRRETAGAAILPSASIARTTRPSPFPAGSSARTPGGRCW